MNLYDRKFLTDDGITVYARLFKKDLTDKRYVSDKYNVEVGGEYLDKLVDELKKSGQFSSVNDKYKPGTGHVAASGDIVIKFKKEDVKEGMTYESFAKLIEQELREALSKKTKATLKKKAEKRGLTPGSVYAEYKKGLAAWASSGSRRGMSQHQWAMARVNAATPSKSWAIVKKSKAKKK